MKAVANDTNNGTFDSRTTLQGKFDSIIDSLNQIEGPQDSYAPVAQVWRTPNIQVSEYLPPNDSTIYSTVSEKYPKCVLIPYSSDR